VSVSVPSGGAAVPRRVRRAGRLPDAEQLERAGAGYTALHSAILRGDRTLVAQLLTHGADPNARLEHGTPICRASQDWGSTRRW